MKVGIAFGGRGHAYSLARYLHRQSMLEGIYTYFPRAVIDPELRSRTRSFPYFQMVLFAMSRLKMHGIVSRLGLPANDAFDWWIGRSVEPADVFMAMSGIGLHGRRAAKSLGSLSVCDRGSTHIRQQDRILAEEFDLCGTEYKPIAPELVAKEETEYKEADLVVLQSSFAWKSFLEMGFPPEKMSWISPGVDLETFYPQPKRDSVFRVLYLGQIGLRKGIRYLLEAAGHLKQSGIELVLAGTIMPDAEPFLRRFEGQFRYVGSPRTKADLRELYTQASVFVLPSIEDGFGLVLHEAMACGIPIIATANTGAPDLIENSRQGFVVPIRSPEALADRIIYLSERASLAAEMGQAALETARRHTWDAYGAKVVQLYRQALSARAAAA